MHLRTGNSRQHWHVQSFTGTETPRICPRRTHANRSLEFDGGDLQSPIQSATGQAFDLVHLQQGLPEKIKPRERRSSIDGVDGFRQVAEFVN